MADDDSDGSGSYLISGLVSFAVLGFVQVVLPGVIPFSTFGIWKMKGAVLDWLRAGLPLFAWGICLTAALMLLQGRPPAAGARHRFFAGAATSLIAGVMEEICFRWLIFYAGIATLLFLNFLMFGFAGFGLFHFAYANLLIPVADFLTLGKMHALLHHPAGWAVGAALISSNASFRDGHSYLGPIGFMNSWFIGMFMFWVAFTYGLPAAILLHFLYDIMIDVIIYVASVARRNR